jgi:hypothetical protein
MKPSEKGRFCGDCKKVVHDLSRMRERDARELLSTPANEGLCVRFLYDKHGKVFFGGDLVPASFLQRAKRVALAAAAVAVPLSLQACSPSLNADDDHYEMMGGMPASNDPPVTPQDRGDAEADADSATPDATAKPDAADAGPDAPMGDAETPL